MQHLMVTPDTKKHPPEQQSLSSRQLSLPLLDPGSMHWHLPPLLHALVVHAESLLHAAPTRSLHVPLMPP
jgi:hypothetical protein